MIEVRFHGRGGQGAVIASTILAEAAFIEGKEVSAFPFFGVERRGAPVTAYTRIDGKKIRNKSGIYAPDFVIVMDPSLLDVVNVVDGLKAGGKILVNTRVDPVKLRAKLGLSKDHVLATVDATGIAIKHRLGSKAAPIVNSAVLGAFSKISNVVQLDPLIEAVRNNVPIKVDENAAATKEAFDAVVVH